MRTKEKGGLRVVLGFGTRPEAIKLAPVHIALRNIPEIDPQILVTGQHQDQLDQALSVFGLRATANLRVKTFHHRLPELVERILPEAARYLRSAGADYVLVQGDTLSTFAIAWASFLEGIPLGHVEAGLRSHRLSEPYPEEANRRLTSVLADLHLAPTPLARESLVREGVEADRILVTGQTGVDALLRAVETGRLPSGLPPGPFVVVTLHRRENWSRLGELANAVRLAAERHREFTFVLPLHPNPVVRSAIRPVLGNISNVAIIEPLGYGEMAALLAASSLIVTDSGGLQEEGVTLGVRVLVLREVTERPEGIGKGLLTIAGVEAQRIFEAVHGALASASPPRPASMTESPYGDGKAAVRVANAVAWRLGIRPRPTDWPGAAITEDRIGDEVFQSALTEN